MKKNALRFLLVAVLGTAAFRSEAPAKDVPFVPKTETIQGTISTVDVPNKLLILKNTDGIFFDFQIQRNTTIAVGTEKAKLEDLANQTGKEAAVTFRMLRTGDVALKIEVH